MELDIKVMQPEDACSASMLEAQAFSEPWKEQDFLDMLGRDYTLYLCAFVDGSLAGCCGYIRSFETADIMNVVVDERLRGRGIAAALLSELMQRGRNEGIERFTLEVRAGNEAALHLYRKLGFHEEGRRRNFYSLPTEDAIIMWTD